MRLYKAVCAWLEANAQQMGKVDEHEPHPEGDVYAQAEHAHSYTTQPEMHIANRGQSIDDDDGGAYKISRPISLRWQP